MTGHGAGALVAPTSHGISKSDMSRLRELSDQGRLILVEGQLRVIDVLFRMLGNPELARAMGFDDDESTYEFAGTKSEVSRQIGNAVPVRTATALVTAIMSE